MNILTEWYDKFIDFAKQKLDIVVWVFISSAILLFNPYNFLRVIHLDNLSNYILSIIGVAFLLSGTRIIIKVISSGKQYYQDRKEKKCELSQKRKLLAQLEGFYTINELRSGFKSQKDCISWANKVAPLVKFNDQYYMNFIDCSHKLNVMGISGQLGQSLLNTMISQVEMAIYDLRQDITNLESK